MNNLKIQQEILKAILANPENVKHYGFENRIGEQCTFLTITGTVGYVLRNDDLRIDLYGAQITHDPGLEKIIQPDNLLIGSDTYRRAGTARRYDRAKPDTEPVYVDTGLLKYFDRPTLFQLPDRPWSMIVVAEEPWEDGNLYVRGVVMPVKVENEITENDDAWTE